MPIFFIMLLGYVMRRSGAISERFAIDMNAFVFKTALPVSLFTQVYQMDFRANWDGSFLLLCTIAVFVSIGIAWLLSRFMKDRGERGEFIQASYRGSSSILGLAYLESMYGQSTMGSLLILGTVPLYNVMAVLILSLSAPGEKGLDRASIKKALIGVLKNPLLWGIVLGMIWSMTGITMPYAGRTTLSYLARLASPMGLLAMGARLDLGAVRKVAGPVFASVFLKLIGCTALFLPVAAQMGMRSERLLAVLIMSGSAATVSGYVMAKNMGHKGDISAGSVALSTIAGSFTMTFWIWILKSLALI